MNWFNSFFIINCFLFTVNSFASIETREIKYEVGGKSFSGVLSWDKAIKTQMPAVLIIHEWWGLNDYVRKRAKQLAELGYISFALDMYGDGKHTENPTEAKQLMTAVHGDWNLAQKRFEKAIEVLRKNPQVKSEKMAVIGYCFGGGVALEMAKRGINLAAFVSFHGTLNTPSKAEKNKIPGKILVLNGASDGMVANSDVEKFKKEMDTAQADYKFINYNNAKHAFTNPEADKLGKLHNIPIAYNKEADEASWNEMKRLFNEVL